MPTIDTMTHKALVEAIQKPVGERGIVFKPTAEAKRELEAKSAASTITDHMFFYLTPVQSRILRSFKDFPGKGLTINHAASWCQCSTSAVPKRMSELRGKLEQFGLTIIKIMKVDSYGRRYGEYFLARIA